MKVCPPGKVKFFFLKEENDDGVAFTEEKYEILEEQIELSNIVIGNKKYEKL